MSERTRNYGKVSEDLYQSIHARGVQGGLTNKELGKLYGVSGDTAKRCVRAESFAEYRELIKKKTDKPDKSAEGTGEKSEESKKREFDEMLCTVSGDGFIKGHTYAMMGWNNGLHVLRETVSGDIYDKLCFNYGDEIGAADETGVPRFTWLNNPEHQTVLFKALTEVFEDLAGRFACMWKD